MEQNMIIAKATELGNSMEQVTKAINKNASVRCRLNKMPGRADFALKMAEADAEHELLLAVKAYLQGPTKNVNTLTEEEISKMDYITVTKAIRAIQSKKTHTKWAEDCEKDEEGLFIPGTGEAYKEACRIEELLKARRAEVAPEKERMFSQTVLVDKLDAIMAETGKKREALLEEFVAFVKGGDDNE